MAAEVESSPAGYSQLQLDLLALTGSRALARSLPFS